METTFGNYLTLAYEPGDDVEEVKKQLSLVFAQKFGHFPSNIFRLYPYYEFCAGPMPN